MDKKRKSMILMAFICLVLVHFLIQPSMVSPAEVIYPTKPIKLIVNFSAGGTTDICCRKLAHLAGAYLGQEIIVENKVGAGGIVGARFLAKSNPDGYTIGALTTGVFITGPAFHDLDFDPRTEYAPIVQFGMADHPLAVPIDSPIKSFKDFIEEGRKRELKIAGSGLTPADIAMDRLAAAAKIRIKIVAFGGLAPSLPAVLGGHTDAIISSGYYEQVRGGKLRLIAQTTEVRNKEFPEVPTLKELGYDIEVFAGYGISAPKGVPEPIRKKLEEAFTQAVRDPSFAQTVHNASVTLVYRNGEDYYKWLKEAYEKSQKEYRELGLGKYGKQKK